MSVASSSTSSKASSKAESRRASSSTSSSSSSKSRSDSSHRSQSSTASVTSVNSLDLVTQKLRRLFHLKDTSTKRRKAVMNEFVPRYCFGSTAIFIIVFCLLCSLSALGPRFLDSMMIQDLQSEKEYPDIDTSTCQIQPLQAPDREVQANFLTSYPGSGARLLSRLVEALSGIPTTDDVYSNGVTNTIGINTYYPCPEGQETPGADSVRRAAVLIRHPLDSIPSYHNLLYQQMNNVPIAPEEDWAIWAKTKLLIQIEVWTKHFEYWLDRYPAKNRLVVSYDQLLSPKRGPGIAKELAEFLNLSNGVVTVPAKDVPCVWQRLVDEYELTLPPSERRPRTTKRVLPRKQDRNGSVRAKPQSNSDQDEAAQNDADANGRSRSNRRGGDDDQHGRSKRGSKQHGVDQEEQSMGPRKPNRLGGKQQNHEEEQQEGEEEEQPEQVSRKWPGTNRNGGGNQEGEEEGGEEAGQQEGEEEEQTEEVSTEERVANQRGGNPRQQVDQHEGDNNEEQSNEESNETEEEGGNEEENQDAESDQQQGGDNEGESIEAATERRGAVQQNRGRPNKIVSKDEEADGGEGEQISSEEGDSPNQQRWRERRRLSADDMGVSQRRRLLEIKKYFPIDGRKELLIQLSRLLEKYHGDENISGILVEYIDELERRYPTN